MKILIQQIKTKLYLNSGDWIADIKEAHNFERGADAIQYAFDKRLKNIEIIHSFDDPTLNFSTGEMSF